MILRGTVFSKILEMDTSITVVGPDRYEPGKPYQVVYLLHGLCGNSESWTSNSMLHYYARGYNALFILPEAGRSFYSDMKYGQRYFSYVSQELPELIKQLFNIFSHREDTIVMGGSMGGFGALKCALSRPDFYGRCAALAPACLYLPEQLKAFGGEKKRSSADSGSSFKPNEQLIRDFVGIFGINVEIAEVDDILGLARNIPPGAVKPEIYTACGLGDGFLAEVRGFSEEARAFGFKVTYEEWGGGHNWRFFNQALEKALFWCFGESSSASSDAGRYAAL